MNEGSSSRVAAQVRLIFRRGLPRRSTAANNAAGFMHFNEEDLERLQSAWNTVQLVRPVHYGLFTFGESRLPYYLVCLPHEKEKLVAVRQGEVRVTRPMILTPDNAPPELQNFFEDQAEQAAMGLLLSRTASFRHLKIDNQTRSKQMSSDSVEEVVERINRDLDSEEEEHTAVLVSPAPLAGIAVLRYTMDRIMQSAPGNVQELRERGFLP